MESADEHCYDNYKKLLQATYGLADVSLESMSGWTDESLTFCATVHGRSQRYIFKVFEEDAAKKRDMLDGETAMLNYLYSKGFPVPKIIQTLQGESYREVAAREGRIVVIKLQTFIEGRLLGQNATPEICRQVGALMGRITCALADFEHPYYSARQKRFPLISQEVNAYEETPNIDDKHSLSLAVQCRDLFEKKMARRSEELPCQPLHGDCQGANIIMDNELTKINGIIDFLDSRNAYRILEPTCAMATFLAFGDDPVACCRAFLGDYQCHVKFLTIEKESLLTAVLAWLLQAMCLRNKLARSEGSKHLISYLDKINGRVEPVIEKLLCRESPERKFFEGLCLQP